MKKTLITMMLVLFAGVMFGGLYDCTWSGWSTPENGSASDYALHGSSAMALETTSPRLMANISKGNVPVVSANIVRGATVARATTILGCVRKNGKVVGSAEIKLGKASPRKGSKVSGSFTLFGQKKLSLKASTYAMLDYGPVDMPLAVAREGVALIRIGAKADGTLSFRGAYGDYVLEAADVGGEVEKRGSFVLVDEFPETINGGTVNTTYLPDGEPVTMLGRKWTCAKAAAVKYAKDRTKLEYSWVVNNGKNDPNKTNLSGLKLSYSAKNGTFKGSFRVYTLLWSKMKKVSVTVKGLMVDGVGYGVATVKKVGDFAIMIDSDQPSPWVGLSSLGSRDSLVSTAAELRAAIENAVDGATIYLRNGTYAIDSTLQVSKSINLVGESVYGVKIVGDEDNGLDGLYFGGVSASRAINVQVWNCTFTRMDVWYGASVLFQNCRQLSNANFSGLLCYARDTDAPAIARAVNCTFKSATCSMGVNAQISLDSCTIDQTGTNEWGFYASEGDLTAFSSYVIGGDNGVFATGGSVVTVNNCEIRNAYCAVSSFNNAFVTLTGCTIVNCNQEQNIYQGGWISIK